MPIKFKKPQLTITYLEKRTFLVGIILGLFYSISILLFFGNLREIEKYFSSSIYNNLFIFDDKNESLIRLSYSLTSICLGFSFCVHYWFKKNRNYSFNFISNQALFILWFVIFSFSSFSKINAEIIGYQYFSEILIVLDDYKLLLFIVPLYIYLYNWGLISKKFSCKKWKIYSLLIICFISIIFYFNFKLFSSTSIKDYYISKNKWKREFLQNEITNSKKKYNIIFDSLTISTLRKDNTKSSIKFSEKINQAFNTKTPISLDTIIFAKVLVNNKLNFGYKFPYPNPKSIYYQTTFYSKYSSEYRELINLLELEQKFVESEMYNLKDYTLLSILINDIINKVRLNGNFTDKTPNQKHTTKKQL